VINLNTGMEWLNALDRSHLIEPLPGWITEIHDLSLSEGELHKRQERILRETGNSIDLLTAPEVTFHFAAVEYQREQWDEAIKGFESVEKWYRKNGQEHRTGVAEWLAGMAAWKQMNNNVAYAHWVNARENFTQLAEFYRRRRAGEQSRWYLSCLEEIRVEMAKTAEEAYSWLDAIDHYPMDKQIKIVVQKMEEYLREGKYASANELMENLTKISSATPDVLEKPQILAACGLASFQMHLLAVAEDQLEEAVHRFLPDSHRQAAGRWILGAVQWQMKGGKEKAQNNWRRALDAFERLETAADYHHAKMVLAWYQRMIPSMKTAMQEKSLGK
jgi:tetratricopeptide (TPR) repeat protein